MLCISMLRRNAGDPSTVVQLQEEFEVSNDTTYVLNVYCEENTTRCSTFKIVKVRWSDGPRDATWDS